MGFGEKRGNYWRGRYKIAPGKHLTVVGEDGKPLKFRDQGRGPARRERGREQVPAR